MSDTTNHSPVKVEREVLEYAIDKYVRLHNKRTFWTRKLTIERMNYGRWLRMIEPIDAQLRAIDTVLFAERLGLIYNSNTVETYNRLKVEYEEQK